MGELWEKYAAQNAKKQQENVAVKMLRKGKNSIEDIAEYTDLPIERVKELESEITA